MSSTTLKRCAILIGVFGLIVVTVGVIQRFQVDRLARSVAERADAAANDGEFEKAAKLYKEHLVVVPDDAEIQVKYADMLLKGTPSPQKQATALERYADVLRRFPGREDVRRRQMELKFAMGRLTDAGAAADLQILLTLPQNKTDGNLLFLMGRCCEEGKNDVEAKRWYEEAIEHDSPRKVEAYQRLATLLRRPDRLSDPKAADQVVDAMVQSSPENYQVYLARGRYRRQYGLPGARVDIEKALKLAGDKPEIVLEMAGAAVAESGQDEARRILEAGLARIPSSTELYESLADLELRAGHIDRAIETLERGLKSAANKVDLRGRLANYMAMRGDTDKLLLQIEELKKLGCNPKLLQFLKGYYHVNASQFREARQLLAPLEPLTGWPPPIKTRISTLLARCYGQLGEPELQQEAYLRALRTSPQDVQAKIGLIDHMLKQGDIEEAIKGYRELVKRMPGVGVPLAQLLITRNQQLPAGQRDWGEVKSLIDNAEKSAPESVDPLLIRAGLAVAQDRRAEARDQLEKAQSRFPKSVAIWCARANLLAVEKQFDASSRLLDQGRKELGDQVELRLNLARLAVARGGPQVAATLNELSKNLDPFSNADRRTLLFGLARELARVPDPKGAGRLWSLLAEQEPSDVEIRLNLLEVAFETGDRTQIEKIIKQIEQIEGVDGSLGRVYQARYLIWQADQALTKDSQEALRLRTKARVLLNELATRRADLPAIPVALAQLEQQELRQPGLTDAEIDAKEESIIRSYRRAIDLGQRSPAIVRETVRLLFKYKRGSEALDLVNRIPVESPLAGDLGRQAISYAVRNRDFEHAEELARKAVAAKPADLLERTWLVQILLSSGRQAEAESVIREAVNLSKSDPDRWIMLVKFLVTTKQAAEAEKVVKNAEASLPPLEAPLALAQCCTLMGRSYEGTDDGAKRKWYAQAKGWYEKAQAAHPTNLSVVRRATEFFVQTNQQADVEAQLSAILKRGPNTHGADTVAWARRTLALVLASSPDVERARRALTILEPAGAAASAALGPKDLDDPEDLRTLARVLEAQRTAGDRKRAIDILESLVGKNLANTADRLLLAQLQEASGNWPKALDVYRELNSITKVPRDLDSLNRRPLFLAQFARSLLRNHKAGDEQDLNEAQDLVDQLRKQQPNALDPLILQVDLYRARNELDQALELIQTSAQRTNLAPAALKTLANLAEKLNRNDVAEPLYRQYAALPNNVDGTITLALFLGRRAHVDEALNLLAPLWAQDRETDAVALACLEVLSSADKMTNSLHFDRVAGWLEQAIKQKKGSAILAFNLANVRSEQMRYDEASALYENVIKQAPGSALTPPAINRLLALSYNNLAWLTTLKGGGGRDPMADVNRAIELMGPQADLLDTRGIIHLSLKQTRDAINDLEIAVKNAPSPNKLFHLAQAYFQANDKEKARQFLKEARARGLDDPSRPGPRALHSLEQPAYQKLLNELGMS
jgi:cellulose synthase operon protein C